MADDHKATAHDRKEELKENIIAVLVVLIIVAGAGVWIYIRLHQPADADAPRVQIPVAGSPSIGDAAAPVNVVLFSDFECPFCAEFALTAFPDAYIENGTVLLVFKQFPLDTHPNALRAAQASLCAEDQRRFWEYHDLLYGNQDALAPADLSAYAEQIGMNMTRFADCMERSPDQVALEKQLGKQLGISGTPTFFFNGRKVVGYLSKEQFAAEVEKELADR